MEEENAERVSFPKSHVYEVKDYISVGISDHVVQVGVPEEVDNCSGAACGEGII